MITRFLNPEVDPLVPEGERLVGGYREIALSKIRLQEQTDKVLWLESEINRHLLDPEHTHRLLYRTVEDVPDEIAELVQEPLLEHYVAKFEHLDRVTDFLARHHAFDLIFEKLIGKTVKVVAVDENTAPIDVAHFNWKGRYSRTDQVSKVTGIFAGLWKPDYQDFTVFNKGFMRSKEAYTVHVLLAGTQDPVVDVQFME